MSSRWQHDDLLHAWWVEQGRLLAGEYPGTSTPERTIAKLGVLVESGIDSIVDLTADQDGLIPYRDRLQGIRYANHPIPDMGVIDHAGYDGILARIGEEMDNRHTVYVHCWGGKGRTSTVIGCLLIDGGLDYDATIARIAELREGTRKAGSPCPESAAQHQLLKARADRKR